MSFQEKDAFFQIGLWIALGRVGAGLSSELTDMVMSIPELVLEPGPLAGEVFSILQ